MAAAALKRANAPPLDTPEEDEELDLVPDSMKTWRTKGRVIIGVTAELASGEWVAMTEGTENLTVHETEADASLHLTLAYMRRAR